MNSPLYDESSLDNSSYSSLVIGSMSFELFCSFSKNFNLIKLCFADYFYFLFFFNLTEYFFN